MLVHRLRRWPTLNQHRVNISFFDGTDATESEARVDDVISRCTSTYTPWHHAVPVHIPHDITLYQYIYAMTSCCTSTYTPWHHAVPVHIPHDIMLYQYIYPMTSRCISTYTPWHHAVSVHIPHDITLYQYIYPMTSRCTSTYTPWHQRQLLRDIRVLWLAMVHCFTSHIEQPLDVEFIRITSPRYLTQQELIIVISESSAHLVVVHVGSILPFAPSPGHFFRIQHCELSVRTLPADARGIDCWVGQDLQKELPELDLSCTCNN